MSGLFHVNGRGNVFGAVLLYVCPSVQCHTMTSCDVMPWRHDVRVLPLSSEMSAPICAHTHSIALCSLRCCASVRSTRLINFVLVWITIYDWIFGKRVLMHMGKGVYIFNWCKYTLKVALKWYTFSERWDLGAVRNYTHFPLMRYSLITFWPPPLCLWDLHFSRERNLPFKWQLGVSASMDIRISNCHMWWHTILHMFVHFSQRWICCKKVMKLSTFFSTPPPFYETLSHKWKMYIFLDRPLVVSKNL